MNKKFIALGLTSMTALSLAAFSNQNRQPGKSVESSSTKQVVKESKKQGIKGEYERQKKIAAVNKDHFDQHNTIQSKLSESAAMYKIPSTLDAAFSEYAQYKPALIQGVVKNWHSTRTTGTPITLLEFYVNEVGKGDTALVGKTIFIAHEGGQIKRSELAANVPGKNFDGGQTAAINGEEIIFDENVANPIPRIGTEVAFVVLDNPVPEKLKVAYGRDDVYSVFAGENTQFIKDKNTNKYVYTSSEKNKDYHALNGNKTAKSAAVINYLDHVNQLLK